MNLCTGLMQGHTNMTKPERWWVQITGSHTRIHHTTNTRHTLAAGTVNTPIRRQTTLSRTKTLAFVPHTNNGLRLSLVAKYITNKKLSYRWQSPMLLPSAEWLRFICQIFQLLLTPLPFDALNDGDHLKPASYLLWVNKNVWATIWLRS